MIWGSREVQEHVIRLMIVPPGYPRSNRTTTTIVASNSSVTTLAIMYSEGSKLATFASSCHHGSKASRQSEEDEKEKKEVSRLSAVVSQSCFNLFAALRTPR